MLRSSVSLAGSMNWKPVSPNWTFPDRQNLEWKNPAAIAAEADFLAGIRAWRAHPWHRDLPDPGVIWREATGRLLDYGGDGPTVLFVPSLINRWTVLDLMPGHSMLRWLAGRGVHPLLLDWGEPEPAFSLTDHIAGRLGRAMQAAHARYGKVVLAGYCMGGTFATAAAALRPDLVNGLALLAAPWDFHAGDVEHLHKLTATCAMLEPLLRDADTVPVELLQTLFALDDPTAVAEKFRQFGRLDQDSAAARLFVALEDWLNDGVPLSGTTARECLRELVSRQPPVPRVMAGRRAGDRPGFHSGSGIRGGASAGSYRAAGIGARARAVAAEDHARGAGRGTCRDDGGPLGDEGAVGAFARVARGDVGPRAGSGAKRAARARPETGGPDGGVNRGPDVEADQSGKAAGLACTCNTGRKGPICGHLPDHASGGYKLNLRRDGPPFGSAPA